MRHNITTQDLKKSLGNVIDTVRLRGDRYIIERRGKPVAAIVPVEMYERDERQRQEIFKLVHDIQSRNMGNNPEEIEKLIADEITAVRKLKHNQPAA